VKTFRIVFTGSLIPLLFMWELDEFIARFYFSLCSIASTQFNTNQPKTTTFQPFFISSAGIIFFSKHRRPSMNNWEWKRNTDRPIYSVHISSLETFYSLHRLEKKTDSICFIQTQHAHISRYWAIEEWSTLPHLACVKINRAHFFPSPADRCKIVKVTPPFGIIKNATIFI
jgi:hypothetical protein